MNTLDDDGNEDFSYADLRENLTKDEFEEFQMIQAISQSHGGITSTENHQRAQTLVDLAKMRKWVGTGD